jgi:hypothetical protein
MIRFLFLFNIKIMKVKIQLPTMLGAAILMLFSGCNDKTDQGLRAIDKDHDFIVFGNIYGECTGDCRELFLVSDVNLFKDAGKNTELKNTLFLDEPLGTDQFLAAAELLHTVPDNLRDNTFKNTDLIDVYADGDNYVYGQINGKSFEIIYDEIDSVANPSLHTYCKTVSEVLDLIQ